jgi:hypothetical protein
MAVISPMTFGLNRHYLGITHQNQRFLRMLLGLLEIQEFSALLRLIITFDCTIQTHQINHSLSRSIVDGQSHRVISVVQRRSLQLHWKAGFADFGTFDRPLI